MTLAQRVHFGRDVAQVFGEKRQPAQRVTKLVEQLVLGTVHPAAIYRGRVVGGNLPELLEAAKVIEADVVASLGAPAQAVDPPVVAARPDRVPVIKRSAPALAGGAEGVRRHAGNCFGLEIVLAQAEEVAVRPHIGAVVGHEDGDISHHPDGTLRAVTPQGMPLLVKEELNHAAEVHLGSSVPCGPRPRPQLRGGPGRAATPSSIACRCVHAAHRTGQSLPATRHSRHKNAQSGCGRCPGRSEERSGQPPRSAASLR